MNNLIENGLKLEQQSLYRQIIVYKRLMYKAKHFKTSTVIVKPNLL